MKYNRFRKNMDDIFLEDAKQRYDEAISKWENHIDSNCISMAQSLHEVVRLGEYTRIEEILDKMVLPTDMKLEVEDYNKNTIGDSSKLRLSGHSTLENIFDFLAFENSVMGAWQVFLLCTVQHCLPKWWHANYDYRSYLFSKEDFKYAKNFGGEGLPFSQEYIENLDVSPEIYFNNNLYYISCCFWAPFKGLCRAYFEISFRNDYRKPVGERYGRPAIDCFRINTLYNYVCPILF